MEELWSDSWPLILTRAIHFGSCLLAFGVVAFDLWVAAPALKDQPAKGWSRIVSAGLWGGMTVALLSGFAWLGLNAMEMSGLPTREALKSDVLQVVLSETHFGRLWEIRGAMFLAIFAVMVLRIIRPLRLGSTWIATLLTGGFAASLAWAGHGQDGNHPEWHLATDALHILIGGIWPIGLLPFAICFLKLRHDAEPDKWPRIGRLTRRFSTASLISVALLVATGLVNSFYMLDTPSDLWESDYGKVLLAKIVTFLLMVALGALNLLRWKPRLSAEYNDRTPAAAARLQLNVGVETMLATVVLLLVGLLGTMSPPMPGMPHMHEHHHHHAMDGE